MSRIIRGDQYALPFAIKQGSAVITDSNVDGLRIRLGAVEKAYPGELTYDQQAEAWMYPMRQDESLTMPGATKCQIEIVIGDDIFRSDVLDVSVGRTIIPTVWEGNDDE